ncbi:MAG: glycosyltransferase [Candidatus Zixiibacteriota bacterium]|nr:MAG: glycosyltransferase [candidate division Zixibacteria bacterium]
MSIDPIRTRKKKVLILAYYFPPLGMGGVQRVTKFVKYLPLFGWKPYVLTVKDTDYWAKDYSLLKELPSEAKVIRTGSFDPLRVSWILKSLLKRRERRKESAGQDNLRRSRLSSWFFFPDTKVGWLPFALMKGLFLCRKEKFDLIFSSSPPPSLHLTGYLLKLATGTPWIADFRDPWTGYKLESLPTRLHQLLRGMVERLIVSKADKVIAANPAIKGALESRNPVREKICQMSQGYDEEDFGAITSASPETFVIGYLGTFSPDCDPEPFFAALGDLIGRRVIPRHKVRLVHVGVCLGIDFDRLVQRYGLEDVVQQKGYLPHKEALKEMGRASLLLLVTSDHPLVFPAKIFECLRLGKPILGLVNPKSQIAALLNRARAGEVVSPEDQAGVKRALTSYFSAFEKGELACNTDQEVLQEFERRFLTSKLASLFDRVAGR